jgi:diguanylate cyclase (GGDEF)-like protein
MSEGFSLPNPGEAIPLVRPNEWMYEAPAVASVYAREHRLGMMAAFAMPEFQELASQPETGIYFSVVSQTIKATELQRSSDLAGHVSEKVALKQEAASATYTANHDALTGLYRREAIPGIMERIKNVRGRREGEGRSSRGSVVMVDIDHFKAVNDEHGHSAGDDVLREVAARLSGNLREGDYAIRVGGEEILLLLSGTRMAGASKVAERLREKLAETPVATRDGKLISVTASFGVANLDPENFTKGTESADIALYAAKTRGRDQVVRADQLPSATKNL